MSSLPAVERFETNTGVRIYRLPLDVFGSGFIGYSYVILNAGVPTLVDTGSGYPQSNEHLLSGFQALRDDFGETLQFSDLQRILVTHGHIDHFGGVTFALDQASEQTVVGIHALDRRVLTAYEERVIIASKDLRVYLERAGLDTDKIQVLMGLYAFAKKHVRSVPVNFLLDEQTEIDGMRFIHTPGHCPGQVCILIGDVLISADHVLSRTTPHQAPESITHYTGLGHYRDSLHKIANVDGIQLALGGHEEPITDFYARVDALHHSHERKLNRVLDIVRDAGEPVSIAAITHAMYPDKQHYEELLAIEEAGAHVEFLYDHGELSIANLEAVDQADNPVPLYVVSV
jgi:glyoxylase-like metal-dependent hydrolase (beta-lactamase superfamily II)